MVALTIFLHLLFFFYFSALFTIYPTEMGQFLGNYYWEKITAKEVLTKHALFVVDTAPSQFYIPCC